MHSNGVTSKKNYEVCKYDPSLNSGADCIAHNYLFSCGTHKHPCPAEFRKGWTCALGNEMLIEIKHVIFKEKLYEPIWD